MRPPALSSRTGCGRAMRSDRDLAGLAAARDDDATVDPFADLLFALAAAVLPVILVLLPAIHLAVGGSAAREPRRDEVTVDGRPAWIVVAQSGGLLLPSEGGRLVALDAIADDGGLRAALAGLKRDGRPLLLVIEPDGTESAFVLEPVLAAFGSARIEQARATTTCETAGTDALARACAARVPESPRRTSR